MRHQKILIVLLGLVSCAVSEAVAQEETLNGDELASKMKSSVVFKGQDSVKAAGMKLALPALKHKIVSSSILTGEKVSCAQTGQKVALAYEGEARTAGLPQVVELVLDGKLRLQ